jgi:signal transduction histidine kinase
VLNKTTGSLAACVRSALEGFLARAAGKRVSLALEADGDTTCEGDWAHLERVFAYLLDNALEFPPQGSRVDVEVWREGDSCVLRVSDQGPGVPVELRERIFEEFAITDVAHHGRGQGLSLALARLVAEFHDGSISVGGTEGQGATFTLHPSLAGGPGGERGPAVAGRGDGLRTAGFCSTLCPRGEHFRVW